MNTRSLLAVFSLLAVSTAVSATLAGLGRVAPAGAYSPIKDLTDPHVVDIANYAVKEHNNQGGDHLQYDHIVKGEQQLVAGINYRLVIAAKDSGAATKNYEAIVWEKAQEHFRKLKSFKAVRIIISTA